MSAIVQPHAPGSDIMASLFVWFGFRDDAEIPISKYYKQGKEIDMYTLDIFEAFQCDEGVYKITAVNSSGKTDCTCNLKVLR